MKYRPFKDKEECWNEMMKHHPFGWVKHFNGEYLNLTKVDDYGVNIAPELDNIDIRVNDHLFSFTQTFNIYNFIDGTPFGIEE